MSSEPQKKDAQGKSEKSEEESVQGKVAQEEALLAKQMQELKESLKECQNKYLLMLADSENARKRMQKDSQEMTKYAVENVLADFLQPIDNFQKALKFAEAMSPEVKNWAIGFEMILGQFKQILANHGVEEYHSVGKRFDPRLHEAVEMIVTDEYEPGVVVEEDLRGYKVGERPIRVARVKVAKAQEFKQTKEEKQEG